MILLIILILFIIKVQFVDMYSENLILFLIAMPVITTWFLLDIVRKFSIKLRLFAVPNERSSHDKIIPTTGGVALCISWLLIIFINVLFSGNEYQTELYYYGVAGTIISIIGFYDDLNEIPSLVKLLMQIFVAVEILKFESSIFNQEFY